MSKSQLYTKLNLAPGAMNLTPGRAHTSGSCASIRAACSVREGTGHQQRSRTPVPAQCGRTTVAGSSAAGHLAVGKSSLRVRGGAQCGGGERDYASQRVDSWTGIWGWGRYPLGPVLGYWAYFSFPQSFFS